MTQGTSVESFTPSHITVTQALVRVGEIRDLMAEGDIEAVEVERTQLYLDTLFSITYTPNYTDKRELRQLAGIALEAFEIKAP